MVQEHNDSNSDKKPSELKGNKSRTTKTSPASKSEPKGNQSRTTKTSSASKSEPKGNQSRTTETSPASKSEPKGNKSRTTKTSPASKSEPKGNQSRTTKTSPASKSEPKGNQSRTTETSPASKNEDSQSYKKMKKGPDEKIDLAKLDAVFIVFGLLSLLTAYFFSRDTDKLYDQTIYIGAEQSSLLPYKDDSSALVGPLQIQKNKTVLDIKLIANLQGGNSWVFLESEVLDHNKEYLFSFGKELWRETGRDYEGRWQESDNKYEMKVTFPKSGSYYLKFNAEGSGNTNSFKVKITKQRGSHLPYFWFGILCLGIVGILNLYRNRKFFQAT